MKVMEVAEAKEGRLMELAVMGDFKEMDMRLYQVLRACSKGEAKNQVCNPARSGFVA